MCPSFGTGSQCGPVLVTLLVGKKEQDRVQKWLEQLLIRGESKLVGLWACGLVGWSDRHRRDPKAIGSLTFDRCYPGPLVCDACN